MSDPVVTLAGKQYPVPPLVPRQLRVVLPALLRALPKMMAWSQSATEGKVFDLPFPTDAYDDILVIAYQGAIWPNDKKADPGCLFDQVVTFNELAAAIVVIQSQTGMFGRASGGANAGEAQDARNP